MVASGLPTGVSSARKVAVPNQRALRAWSGIVPKGCRKEDPLADWTFCETTDEAEDWVVLSCIPSSDSDEQAAQKGATSGAAFQDTMEAGKINEDDSESEEDVADEEQLAWNRGCLSSEVAAAMTSSLPARARAQVAAKSAAKKDLTRAARKNLWRQRVQEQMDGAEDVCCNMADPKMQQGSRRRSRRCRGDESE